MKKLLLSFVAIALAVISVRAQVEINSTNFPDDNFRAQVKEAFDSSRWDRYLGMTAAMTQVSVPSVH